MANTVEVQPDAAMEKRTRRRFSGAEKRRLLDQFDVLNHGEKGAWLRREGLYAGQLSVWRRELREHGPSSLDPKASGRKPADPRDRQIEQLRRENARLAKRAQVAEALVELQKKVLALADQSDPNDWR
jgi:transposase-like protein